MARFDIYGPEDERRTAELAERREEVEEFLRELHARKTGEVTLPPKLSPPAQMGGKVFGSMFSVDTPFFDNVRKQNELRLDADRQATEALVDATVQSAGRALPGYGAPAEMAAGSRRPLPSMSTGDGGNVPTGYLDALRRAQQQDDMNAAFGRLGQAGEQFAEIASRGVYKASPLAPMPSEVSKEEKRRQAVLDYLKQQRDAESSAVDAEYKRGLLKRMAEPKPVAPPKPGLTQEQVDKKFNADLESTQAGTDAKRRQPAPRVVRAPPSPKPEKEPKPVEGVAVGYDIDKARPPSKDQIKDFGNIVANRYELAGLTGKMRRLAKEFNALERAKPGSGKTQVQQTARQIQIRAKDIAGLGALSGPDMALMESLASNPADISTAFVDLQAQMDGLDDWALNAESARAKAWGFKPASAAPPIAPDKQKRLDELRAKKAAGTLGGK